MIGEHIKHYEIISQLGAGGMGEVFLAKDTRLDRQVALKFLPREIATDPERRQRLELEAKTASSLDHPNILTIYEVDDDDGRPFISMAYVEGGSLKERLASGPIGVEDAVRYGVQIASGLGAAHARGIVHRDIKPDNILLDGNNRARLTDFGLAKLKESSGLTGRGTAVGTVGYMSPEQAQGLEVDARSDVFSLGVLLYELFTGKRPFVAEHAAAALYSIVHEQPTPIREINPEVPEPLAEIIERALEKIPASRQPDARAVETELRTIAHDLEFSRISQSGLAHVPAKHGKTKRVAWAGVGALIILAGLFLTMSPDLFDSEGGEVQAIENSLAVMYFENLSDPNDEERLGDIITELLTTDLSGSSYLKVISTQRLHDLLSQQGHSKQKRIDREVATKIASESGASRMLIGTLSKLGGRTIITAQLVNVSTGEVVGSQRVDGTDVFAVVDELSTRIKEEIGLSGSEVFAGDMPVSEATTSSAEAYREYLIGMDYYHSVDWNEAHLHFDRALALDSTFALAYLRKGIAYSSDGQQERGMGMLRTAAQYIEKTTGCDRLLLQTFAIDFAQNLDMEAALTTLKTATKQFPTHKEPFFWVANLQSGRPGRDDTVRYYAGKALELDPNYPFALLMMANLHIRGHEYAKARPIIERYMSVRPRDVLPYGLLTSILVNTDKFDSALIVARSAVDNAPENRIPMTDLVGVHAIRGEPDSAIAWAERIREIESSPFNDALGLRLIAAVHRTWGDFDKCLDYYSRSQVAAESANLQSQAAITQRLLGTLHRDLGLFEKALPYFRRSTEIDTLNPSVDHITEMLVELGREEDARREIAQFVERWGDKVDSLRLERGRLELEGRFALQRGDPSEAIRRFLEVRQLAEDTTELQTTLARAYLAASQYANAIKELTDSHEEARHEWPTGHYIASHLILARAYVGIGQHEKARESLEFLLSYWGGSDWNTPVLSDARALYESLSVN